MTDPTSQDSSATPPGENPYAPQGLAPMRQPAAGEARFIAEGRRVPAGNGVSWLGGGWDLFKESPGIWILFAIILVVVSMVMSFVPLGQVALSLVWPVLVGGLMLGCAAIKQGEPLEISHLFAGFSTKAGPLMLVGLIYFVGTLAIMLIGALVAFFGIGSAGLTALMHGEAYDLLSGLGGLMIAILFAVLIALMLLIPLLMAFWFAPALVVFHNIEPLAAMRASFKACLTNFGGFLLYGLVGLVLAVVASIPFMLGWLVLVPVSFGSIYAGYRDIFFER